MKWFPDQIDGNTVKDEEEPSWRDVLPERPKPDLMEDLLRSLQESDQVELPANLYPVIEWISGPGHLLINPLFLKMYGLLKYPRRFRAAKVILAGAILSLSINLAIYFSVGLAKVFEYAYAAGVLSILLIMGITLFRILFVALVSTPRSIANELDRGLIHLVFPTPLSDDEIFYGASIAHLLKAYPILEEGYSLLFGYVGVYLIVIGPLSLNELLSFFVEPTVAVLIILCLTVALMILVPLVALLASRAAGLYSLTGSWLGVVFSGLGHLIIVGMIAWGLAALAMYLGALWIEAGPRMVLIITSMISVVVVSAIIWIANLITGRLGVWALGRFRRKTVGFW